MIKEFVKCDVCGKDIPKQDRSSWHNINVVKHYGSRVNSDLTTSFHVCTKDFQDFLFKFLGSRVTDREHKLVLNKQLANKLNMVL